MEYIVRDIELGDIPSLRSFKCNNPSMENFLNQEAYKSHICGEGITKIVLKNEEIIAYYTLKCDALRIEDPEMYTEPRYIPCVEISRLAVVSHWQRGQRDIHLGTHLMGEIITFVREEIASRVGCRFITLHALKDKVGWYQREFDFNIWNEEKPNPDDETVFMYLDIIDNDRVQEYSEFIKK